MFGSRITLSPTRKRVLIMSILIYVIIFHVIYNSYWRSTSPTKQTTSSQNSWSFFALWNQQQQSSDEDGDSKDVLDVHIEDPLMGHTGETMTETGGKRLHRQETLGTNSVAIGSGITSKGLSDVNETNIASKFQLFFTFIPTFCETASPGFDYHFYFSYDSTDGLFKDTNFLWAFQRTFLNATSRLCSRNVTVSIHMVQCSHTGRPTWAQNDAMLEAYLDNVEYYYRINDDTNLITKNWTEMFISVLRGYSPQHVGVVGPNHSGGNTAILTYDFVHRTHVDIFGFYYPRVFTDWWGDDWVTKVYRPDRSTKLENVRLDHTLGLGQRYGVDWSVGGKLQAQLDKDMKTLNRYIKYKDTANAVKVDGKKVIAMSLFGKNAKYSWGAIRNAQLAPIFFPGWKLRIYVTSRRSKAADVKSWLVPKRILNKLKQLGAELAYVTTKSIPPFFWRYLVVDDSGVDYFIVRNADSHLSERDASVVSDWLQRQISNESLNALHCIRDHPNHAKMAIVDGLWGGNRNALRRLLGRDMATLLDTFHSSGNKSSPVDGYVDLIYQLTKRYRTSSEASFSVLSDIVWPLVSSVAYCHDSMSCHRWPSAHAFPVERQEKEYIGQKFDEHQEPIVDKNDELLAVAPTQCTNTTQIVTTTVATTTPVAVNTTVTVTTTAVKNNSTEANTR